MTTNILYLPMLLFVCLLTACTPILSKEEAIDIAHKIYNDDKTGFQKMMQVADSFLTKYPGDKLVLYYHQNSKNIWIDHIDQDEDGSSLGKNVADNYNLGASPLEMEIFCEHNHALSISISNQQAYFRLSDLQSKAHNLYIVYTKHNNCEEYLKKDGGNWCDSIAPNIYLKGSPIRW